MPVPHRLRALAHHLSRPTSTAVAGADGPSALYPSALLAELGAPLTDESPKVIYATRGRVCYITINRPQVLNACDFETYADLAQRT